MKHLINFILIVSLASCIQKGNENSKTINNDLNKEKHINNPPPACSYKQHVFELSSTNENEVGFPEESEFEIGPNSICIKNDTVYFINPLFSKVNAFDLNTDSTFSSISFSKISNSKYSWKPTLIDLAYFNNKFYVLTRSDSIFVLDDNLKLLNSIKINCYGQKEFYKVSENELSIYCYKNSNFIVIDENDVVHSRETHQNFDIIELGQIYLGEKYEYVNKDDSLYFVTQYGKVNLKEEIQPITLHYYQCKNFGFNSKFLVHFAINPNDNKIIFFSYCY